MRALRPGVPSDATDAAWLVGGALGLPLCLQSSPTAGPECLAESINARGPVTNSGVRVVARYLADRLSAR